METIMFFFENLMLYTHSCLTHLKIMTAREGNN